MAYGAWLDAFLDYISNLTIISKELETVGDGGPVPLLDIMYGAQKEFLREVATGLDAGIHSFVNLKARQMGITTICLGIDCFWLTVHRNLQGALITDTEANKEAFRLQLHHYLTSVPPNLRVGIQQHNRNQLVLANGSMLAYLVAGTRKGTSARIEFRACHRSIVLGIGGRSGIAAGGSCAAAPAPTLYLGEHRTRNEPIQRHVGGRATRSVDAKNVFHRLVEEGSVLLC